MTKQLLVIALLLCVWMPAFGQTQTVTSLTADEIMQSVFAHDTIRETQAGGYIGSREYVLENKRLNKRAVMTVAIFADADGTKHFQVVEEEGWKGANKHVLHKMLQSESESSVPATRGKTRVVPGNYEFHLVGSETIAGRNAYELEATPKREDRYLFRGRIWVDAEDFAIARVEGEPAKNPSFWTRSVHFVQQYHKSGSFWFPETTTSLTDAMVFGNTEVTIRYFDYKPACGAEPADKVMEAHYVQH